MWVPIVLSDPRSRNHPTVGPLWVSFPPLLPHRHSQVPPSLRASLLLPCTKPLWPGSALPGRLAFSVQLGPRDQSFHTGHTQPSVASLPILDRTGGTQLPTPLCPPPPSGSVLRCLHCGQDSTSTQCPQVRASCRAQTHPPVLLRTCPAPAPRPSPSSPQVARANARSASLIPRMVPAARRGSERSAVVRPVGAAD